MRTISTSTSTGHQEQYHRNRNLEAGHVKNQSCNGSRSNTSIVNSVFKKSSQTFIYLKDIGADEWRMWVGVRSNIHRNISKYMGFSEEIRRLWNPNGGKMSHQTSVARPLKHYRRKFLEQRFFCSIECSRICIIPWAIIQLQFKIVYVVGPKRITEES